MQKCKNFDFYKTALISNDGPNPNFHNSLIQICVPIHYATIIVELNSNFQTTIILRPLNKIWQNLGQNDSFKE